MARPGHVRHERRSAGLFLVSLATVMYEILLTRIFSVTMWYHFAFMAISLAMFGMTVGAILVYLAPRAFSSEKVPRQLALSALWFAGSILVSFLAHLSIRCAPDASLRAFVGAPTLVLTYVVVSIPFVFSGICVCLALTKSPRNVGILYAADLLGAATGCVLLVLVLGFVDGPTAVTIVACLAALGSARFAAEAQAPRLRRITLIATLSLIGLASVQTWRAYWHAPLVRLQWVKGRAESPPLYEKWNSFSRIAVTGDSNPHAPFGWGLSPTFSPSRPIQELILSIDAAAGTFLTGYHGDPADIEHLRYDVTNLAHYVRRDAKVLIVGVGGGRDILSALAFHQPTVIGVEINRDIIGALNRRFGDFTGHLDRDPRVTFVNDEARSYIARQRDRFDIMQISLIDTWAATAAGAFVLTENSLYTVEAWKTFLEHLTPHGILTCSRWYFRNRPGEVYRLVALANESLRRLGSPHPETQIALVRHMGWRGTHEGPNGVGTLLVSRAPFSPGDLAIIRDITARMRFELVLAPGFALDRTFATLASEDRLASFLRDFPINIAAPTDDRPFFFHMLRLRDLLKRDRWEQGVVSFNMKAVFVLGTVLATVTVLTGLCVIVPLALTIHPSMLKGTASLFVFFVGIGFGFMLVEVSQMQRLMIFLGHPTYGLSVVLFGLLVSSGLGSYLTQAWRPLRERRSAMIALGLLLVVLLLFGVLTPLAIQRFQDSVSPLRILIAVGILVPLGVFMGMPFPLGMRLALGRSAAVAPWLWGMNGAASVCASVLAVAIALSAGISIAFWSGSVCYAIAVAAFAWGQPVVHR